MRPMNEEEQLAAMIQENPQLLEQLQAQQMQEEEALDQIHEVAEEETPEKQATHENDEG